MSRSWSAEDEVNLFSLICDHKPAGPQAEERVQVIVQHLNTNAKGAAFTAPEVWAKLALHFNMKEVNDIENELENEKPILEEKPTIPAEPELNNDAAMDLYSSELSDVEGEDMVDLSRLRDEDEEVLKNAHIARGRRKSTTTKKKDPVSEEPATRKRTRSVAKLGGNEASAKKHQSRSSPSASTAKRRTRSELTPDPTNPSTTETTENKALLDPEGHDLEKQEPQETNAGDETPDVPEPDAKKEEDTLKTRRSTRQSARRSVRKK